MWEFAPVFRITCLTDSSFSLSYCLENKEDCHVSIRAVTLSKDSSNNEFWISSKNGFFGAMHISNSLLCFLPPKYVGPVDN